MKRSGFSLIELLAVMSVLAVVGTLTVPVWQKARDESRRAVCGGNLQQMYAGYMCYLSDHDGNLFPYMENVGGSRLWYWGLEIGSGAEGERIIDRSLGRLAPYLPEGTVETCPAFPYRSSLTKQKYEVSTYGYGLNHYLLLGTSANKASGVQNFASVTRPSDTILWGDSAQVNTFQAPASPSNPMIEEWYYLSHQEATYHFRHGGKVQVVMCDGAVRLFPPSRLVSQCDGQIGFLEPNGQNHYLLPVK